MRLVRNLLLMMLTVIAAYAQEGPPLLRAAGNIEVAGPKGKRFDYLIVDQPNNHLFATHLGAGLLYVIDVENDRVIKTISDLPGIEGVEIAPDVKKLYTSDWFENKIGVIDLGALKLIKKIPTEAKPDGVAYAAPFHKVYVSDERAKAEAVVDVTRDEIVTTLHFDSETGNVRYDPGSRRVLVNLQDKNVIAEIDPATDKEVGRYPLGDCRGNHGMALDSEHRLAFLVCEDNNLLAVFDLNAHRVIASVTLPDGGDVVAYDPGLRRVYVACYSGFISIVQEDDAQHFRKLADVPAEKKVHSLAVDPTTHRIYVPEQEEHGRPAARIAIFEAIQ
jgi:YVTN family beta-propeller protein